MLKGKSRCGQIDKNTILFLPKILFKNKRIIAVLSSLYIIYILYSLQNYVPIVMERCNAFSWEYPLNNIIDIMSDIMVNGTTSVKPVNYIPNNYFYIYSANCSSETHLIIVVKSYVGNVHRRQDIRLTWGSCKDKGVRVVFALGYSPIFTNFVKEEHKKFNDIFQGSFLDKYRNNTYKTIMSYNWLVSKCGTSRYVYFVDDDYFVNIPNILDFVTENRQEIVRSMYGHKQCFKTPIRSEMNKWYISEEEYPYDILPPFLSGGSVLTHINVVRKLKRAFPYIKPISLDDVYVSIVALKLKINLVHEYTFANEEKRRIDVKNIMSSHNYRDRNELYKAWDLFIDSKFWERLTKLNRCV